ncbi:UDP-N-acetylmuramoyl-tripeptide--D-alanyl-D-alanine ligase [Bacillus atrophaeus]|uniref:UDP-N-acetylmuramoyl-tripeptide--D-alanyl-D- alanine ligase n=1 Tax=Bacillus atrophaeus TaxID=1452 RepID=UPI00227DDFA4|nr:UDP-N-acetylmuramoyl-tripeptide--D-alanyl-D-alanine ligase [Bacillus atrophaeus]MCY9106905.1 UDP-N-acetylmuramoyl-tripeptide--D-alanyl-D-alanine ligase [Bacillus atrophaeus]MEC1900052.1 UDP-N-acetylmuramoyl-tripeptide--D-alanyl-D-alanine ligase [Bacillus atrophaeus]MEC2397044.1 UDP-N-acetylmuramoyl-tripeptide--D-alanyl-D-alanine ligase [Bacillus atrophaeus]MED4436029.1 UDP-N-acetylmuramoyl-tripeptide--D-alanyl-D-alanine ligase [Bacillus atrophaeus]MED4565797.1 UDP-N-acetylmuramoyl-tripeptid
MIKRTAKKIAEMVKGTLTDPTYENIVIQGVATDTRKLEKNQLFIPLTGENFNGHTFVGQAFENGVSAVLWNKSEPNPPQDQAVILVDDTLAALQELSKAYLQELGTRVIGVTGSNGKTTTKDMLHAVLQTQFRVHKTEGNFNNHIGLPLTVLSMPEDTEVAVLEMGMSGKGEIDLLTRLANPEAAVITNIGESHMQDLGSREGIAEAKLEITNGLKKDGILIYIGDEPLLNKRSYSCRTKTFGADEGNDYQLEDVKQTEDGTHFSIKGIDKTFFIPVLGKHNVLNAIAAFAAGIHFGITVENAAKGLSGLKVTGMRLELLKSESGVSIINDAYNASPTSMKAAIELIESMEGYGKKMLVLGDMLELGDLEEEFHTECGAVINPAAIDYVFTYGKLGAFIAAGAHRHFDQERVSHFNDKAELLQAVAEKAEKGDLILFKASRGMKLEEIVKDLMKG